MREEDIWIKEVKRLGLQRILNVPGNSALRAVAKRQQTELLRALQLLRNLLVLQTLKALRRVARSERQNLENFKLWFEWVPIGPYRVNKEYL